MSDNVLILGAGFSADAGIPLMGQFMDKMWTISRSGKCNGVRVSVDDLTVLENGLKAREELDGYHVRPLASIYVCAGPKRPKIIANDGAYSVRFSLIPYFSVHLGPDQANLPFPCRKGQKDGTDGVEAE